MAFDPQWIKWMPGNPTSAHWYNVERFNRLISATIASDQDHGRDTLVSEFIAKFRGMTRSSARSAILKRIGVARMTLAKLFDEGNNQTGVASLLTALQDTKPVKPMNLGIIGRQHMESRCINAGAETTEYDFFYIKSLGETDGLPWVIEIAFAYGPEIEDVRLIAGCNWSPGIDDPFRVLDSVLSEQFVQDADPVVMIIHLCCPALAFNR
jgi:hypothetical protein